MNNCRFAYELWGVLRAFRCVEDWEIWALNSHESFHNQDIYFLFLRNYTFDVGKEVRECLEVYRIYEKKGRTHGEHSSCESLTKARLEDGRCLRASPCHRIGPTSHTPGLLPTYPRVLRLITKLISDGDLPAVGRDPSHPTSVLSLSIGSTTYRLDGGG